jgi:rhamnulokinase
MNCLAIDLGAESGRVILGSIANGRIALEEIHRFPNGPVRRGEKLLWKFDALVKGVFDGIEIAKRRGAAIASVSADSWGVDYVIDPAEVFNYRDARGQRGVEKIFKEISWEEIFAETGIQFMPINTLFQLASETKPMTRPILGVADYFNEQLGGRAAIEESMASTFQLFNPKTREWSELLLKKLGLPRGAFAVVVESGTILGESRDFPGAKVIATCSHDTGAAVAATPADPNTRWAYLSSGTWSLMGVERREPIINDAARELNFTNEIGFGRSIRLLKNISGLWLLQECRRAWGTLDYGELSRLAADEPAFRSVIDPADGRFLAPRDMCAEIAAFCRETKQSVPESPAAFTRCILESLALLYRRTLAQLEKLTGEKIEVLHIVGGGSKNALLNQFTADACEVEVLAGPVEATALGNIAIQGIALGKIPSLMAARGMIRKSFPVTRFAPGDPGPWRAARQS